MTNATTAQATALAHTRGPWFFDPVELTIYDGQEKTSKVVACVEERVEPSERSDETSANGWLMAAAPQLKEVLEDMLHCRELNRDAWEPDTIRTLEKARNVLHTAHGNIA